MDGKGVTDLAGHSPKIETDLAAGQLRLDGHLIHVICGDVLRMTCQDRVPAPAAPICAAR